MIFKPHIKRDRITDITLKDLKRLGVHALMLDVDNTMSTHGGQVLTDGLMDWLSLMQSGGIKLIVVSNAKERRVKPFAEKIALPYIHLAAKPLPFGYFKAVRYLGEKRKNTAIVGDQLFTDMLGGWLAGVRKILLTPILLENKRNFIIRRKIERIFLDRYKFKED